MILTTDSQAIEAFDLISKGLALGLFYRANYLSDIKEFTFRVSAHKSHLTSAEKEIERVTFVLSGDDVEVYVSSVRVDVVRVDDMNDFVQFIIDCTHHIYGVPGENPECEEGAADSSYLHGLDANPQDVFDP